MKNGYLSALLLLCLTCFLRSLGAVTVTPYVAWGWIYCYEIETVVGTCYFDPEEAGH